MMTVGSFIERFAIIGALFLNSSHRLLLGELQSVYVEATRKFTEKDGIAVEATNRLQDLLCLPAILIKG